MTNLTDDVVMRHLAKDMGIGSHAMHAVFDKTRVDRATISEVKNPYRIWNNPELRGRSPEDPAYVLAPPHEWYEVAPYLEKLEKLRQNPDLEIKVVICGN